MDAKEARKFTSNNPPVDIEAERRPSLLGRLFRRSSSTESSGMMPNTSFGQSFDGATGQQGSITEAVQNQFMKPQPAKPADDPVFSLFT